MNAALLKARLVRMVPRPVVRLRVWLSVLACRRRRARLGNVSFVGITGSCGKTTAKNLATAVLAARYRAVGSSGGRNTPSSFALTLRQMRPDTEYCVQEMGAGELGELARFADLVRPRIAAVLPIGNDHYAVYRGRENAAREKAAIVRCLPAEGTAILWADDPLVLAMREVTRARVFTIGIGPGAQLRAEAIRSAWPDRLSFQAVHGDQCVFVQTRLCGAHWVPAVLAALGVGLAAGVPLDAAAAAVATVEPFHGRMCPVAGRDGVVFIDDHVKAPVWTLPLAAEFMRTARARRKIIVYGTLSDYPGAASGKYRNAARLAMDAAQVVIFVGSEAHMVRHVEDVPGVSIIRNFPTIRAAGEFLRATIQPGDLILVKASGFADHLERLVMDHQEPVRCWRQKCGLPRTCRACGLVRAP